MSITYRWIEPLQDDAPLTEDWERIEDVLATRGWASLNKRTSRILIAEEDGCLAGFYVFQFFPHVEPMWVGPRYYGKGVADELADRMQQFLTEVHARGYMLVADNPIVAKMAEARGMKRVESPVYIKVGE